MLDVSSDLKKLLKESGRELAEVARDAGIPSVKARDIISGNQSCSLDEAKRIAKACGGVLDFGPLTK
jgi:predicted transcriptional regulator